MGCGGSVEALVNPDAAPEEILAPPGDGPCSFIVKKPINSFRYQVYTGDEEKKKWLHIVNESDWCASKSEFSVETYNGESLVKVEVEGNDFDIKKDVEWEVDSDDSDFSEDDLFDCEEELECKVKLKWKVKRTARFMDPEGNNFATLSVKVKGKSKAELEIEKQEDGTETEEMKCKTKVKKVFYKLNWQGNDLEFADFDNGHWSDWDRKWTCDFLDAEYDAKWGTDELKVSSNGSCLGGDALAVGFALGYFFHPTGYASAMDSKARETARDYVRRVTD
jgi:hypothetical protein